MEQAEFDKLNENKSNSGIIPKDKEKSKDSTKEKPKNTTSENSGGSKTSYAAATSVFDFSRDPDLRKNPTYRCISFGKIVVEISVDRNGKVISANAVSGDLDNECLRLESESYAKRWKFEAKFDAPKSEKGTITFTYMPQ